MNDMSFYAWLHAEAMAEMSERREKKILALALRVRLGRWLWLGRWSDERGN